MSTRNEEPSKAEQAMTAMKIFRKFIVRTEEGELDASGVTSPECYRQWVASRRKECRNPETVFQRTLTGHLGAVDGRHPFTAEEEGAVLKWIRRRQVWTCFANSNSKIGALGFRAKGYHERLAIEAARATTTTSISSRRSVRSSSINESRSSKTKTTTTTLGLSRLSQKRKRKAAKKNKTRNSVRTVNTTTTTTDIARRRRTGPRSLTDLSNNEDSRVISPKKQRLVDDTSRFDNTKSDLFGLGSYLRSNLSSSSSSDSAMLESTILMPPKPVDETTRPEMDRQYIEHLRRAQPPPPPRDNSWHLLNMHYLLSSLWSIVSNVSDPRTWWSLVLGFCRMRVIARGWTAPPTMEDAQIKLAEWQAKYPNHAVNIYDFCVADYTQRIMLQNDLSIQWFGPISRVHGGFAGKKFLPQDAWQLFTTLASAMTYRNTEVPVRMRWLNADSVPIYFDSWFYVDNEARVVIERKIPSSGAELPASSSSSLT